MPVTAEFVEPTLLCLASPRILHELQLPVHVNKTVILQNSSGVLGLVVEYDADTEA